MSRKGKKKPSESRSRPENPPGSSDTADLCGNALDSRPRSRGRSSSPFKRYVAAAVCVFLLLAVALVFGQTVRHEFIAYDDYDYVGDNPQVARGFTAQGVALGLCALPFRQLAPADLALPHAWTANSTELSTPAGTT